jgi:hypothetical protein
VALKLPNRTLKLGRPKAPKPSIPLKLPKRPHRIGLRSPLAKIPKEKSVAIHRAVERFLTELESAAGGREDLIQLLAHAPSSPEQTYLWGLLADPRNDTRNLAKVLAVGGVNLGQFLSALKDAKGGRALYRVMDSVEQYLPGVAHDLMARSVPHTLACRACRGSGKVTTIENSKPKEMSCGVCYGEGAIPVLPDLERQKVALELGGALKKGGGIVVNQNQAQVQVHGAGRGGMREGQTRDAIRVATDKLLYGEAAAEPVVDAELVEEGA